MHSERQARQDISAFRALKATPGNLATGVSLPANANVYVSTSSVLAATTELVSVGARDLAVRAGSANKRHHVGWLESGKNVVKAAGAPGTVSVYVRDGMGALIKIAEG